MAKTRRAFLRAFAAASCLVANAGFSSVQAPRKPTPFPTPPEAAGAQNPAAAATPDSRTVRSATLQQHEKEFTAEVDRLYQLVIELKREVESTPTTEIFSVQMYKRTEEIEKVAKQLRAKAKR